MANKLISINTEKTPGTQLPAVVNTEIKRVIGQPGLTEAQVTTLLEQKLTDFAPQLALAVQSQMNALPERIRLNTQNGLVSIEGLDLSGPNKPVTLNMNLPDGSLTVNGKRVLTVDDALNAAGGSIDQAAVEAAVAAATAPLLQRIAALEAKQATDHDEALNYAGGLVSQFANDLSTKLTADFAKKADTTVTDGLQNQIRLNTQYIDQQVDTLVQYADMELAKKADKTVVQQIIDAFGGNPNSNILVVQGWREAVEEWMQTHNDQNQETFGEVVQFTLDTFTTKRSFQELLDAINGPAATPASVMQMFWLLNDVIESLIAATGIEIDGRVKP